MRPAGNRNPYDRFFRKAFGRPEAARELALNFVPADYCELISAARITVEPDRFVDETIRESQADLLIRAARERDDPSVPGSTDLLVYVLIEHKSKPDRWVAMQVLRYLVRIWEDEREKNGDLKPLPRVIPVVLYHGTRLWRDTTEFADLVDGTEPGDRHVPHFQPLFVNLADLTEAQLHGSLRTITALLFMKYVKHSLLRVGRQMLEVLRRGHEDPESREIAAFGLRTLAAVKEREEMEHLQTLAREARYHRVEEDEVTYAEELLQEGLEKGREQGALAERRAVLGRLLSRRFELTPEDRRRIESCEDPDALDAALDEIVVAETKNAVLAKLR